MVPTLCILLTHSDFMLSYSNSGLKYHFERKCLVQYIFFVPINFQSVVRASSVLKVFFKDFFLLSDFMRLKITAVPQRQQF